MSPYMIFASILTFAMPAEAQVTFPSLNSSPWLGQEMLGRVESNSITVNVVFDQDMQVYLEYGTSSGEYTLTTSTQTASANTPLNVVPKRRKVRPDEAGRGRHDERLRHVGPDIL
jgi:hypothetical protein